MFAVFPHLVFINIDVKRVYYTHFFCDSTLIVSLKFTVAILHPNNTMQRSKTKHYFANVFVCLFDQNNIDYLNAFDSLFIFEWYCKSVSWVANTKKELFPFLLYLL